MSFLLPSIAAIYTCISSCSHYLLFPSVPELWQRYNSLCFFSEQPLFLQKIFNSNNVLFGKRMNFLLFWVADHFMPPRPKHSWYYSACKCMKSSVWKSIMYRIERLYCRKYLLSKSKNHLWVCNCILEEKPTWKKYTNTDFFFFNPTYCLTVHFIPRSRSPWHQQKHYCLHPASFAQIHPVRWTPLEIRLHFSREVVSSFATAVWCLFTYQSIIHCIQKAFCKPYTCTRLQKGKVCFMSYTLRFLKTQQGCISTSALQSNL